MAKHVTFWRMKVNPGQRDELIAFMNEDSTQADMRSAGWESDIVGVSKNDENVIYGAVTWDTSERYYANADSPEQNAVYERMRSMLAEDPEWFDCDVLTENRA